MKKALRSMLNAYHVQFVIVLLLILSTNQSIAQQGNSSTLSNGSRLSNIITAVPFLLIAPDARTGAMGEAGVAVEPDMNAISNNPAKLPFLSSK